jgi:peptidoglycan/LPS O-acetylase OafA/YrhL
MTTNTSLPTLVLRWTARVLGTFIAGMLLLFMIGNHYNPFTMQLREAIHTLFMPVGVVIGLALAWRWEKLGGLIATLGMGGWFAMLFLTSGGLNLRYGWVFALLTLPGLLYLLAGWPRRAHAAAEAPGGHS